MDERPTSARDGSMSRHGAYYDMEPITSVVLQKFSILVVLLAFYFLSAKQKPRGGLV